MCCSLFYFSIFLFLKAATCNKEKWYFRFKPERAEKHMENKAFSSNFT
jgi:hypothetical protein